MSSSPRDRNIERYIEKIRSKQTGRTDIDRLFDGIVSGDRSALSEGITLVESRHPDDIPLGHRLLEKCLPPKNTRRIGITGTPGVGKSTFINTYARLLANAEHPTAILSIDPSSYISRGSILGDKTRMTDLSSLDNVYVRPSATGQTLGGVHERTREAVLLCEAAGYTRVIVETVGVGQSEYFVQRMTDVMVLMLLPGSGDELQGIKKGIMEAADIILVNKEDAFPESAVRQTISEYSKALHGASPRSDKWSVQVSSCSAVNELSVENAGKLITDFFDHSQAGDAYSKKRSDQWKTWFTDSLGYAVRDMALNRQAEMEAHLPGPEELPPTAAVKWVRELFRTDKEK